MFPANPSVTSTFCCHLNILLLAHSAVARSTFPFSSALCCLVFSAQSSAFSSAISCPIKLVFGETYISCRSFYCQFMILWPAQTYVLQSNTLVPTKPGMGTLQPNGRIWPATMLHPACMCLQELRIKLNSTYWNQSRLSIYCPVGMSIVTMQPTKESYCPPMS